MDSNVDRYTVDDETGYLRDAETGEFAQREGEFMPRSFKHPRDTDQYHVATICSAWALEKYYPDVVIKTVKTGDR